MNIFTKKSELLIILGSLILLLFSGCVEKTITINADNYSTNIVQQVLSMSDKNMTEYINSINVYESSDELNKKCKSIRSTRVVNSTPIEDYAGCLEVLFESESVNAKITSVDMFIRSDSELVEYCASEGNTIFYLIGQLEYLKTYTSEVDGYNFNLYAEEYANKYIKDKCKSDEYLNLFNNYNIIENEHNSSKGKLTLAENKYNSVVRKYNDKWDFYITTRLDEIKPSKVSDERTTSEKCTIGKYGIETCTTTVKLPVPTYEAVQVRVCNTYSGQYCGVPEDRYNEYVLDFNEYSKAYDEYSTAYDTYLKSYDEFSKEYDENSNKINETLRNYRYPFETFKK